MLVETNQICPKTAQLWPNEAHVEISPKFGTTLQTEPTSAKLGRKRKNDRPEARIGGNQPKRGPNQTDMVRTNQWSTTVARERPN